MPIKLGDWPVRPSACPQCGEVLDRATDPRDVNAIPRPGNVTICVHCGQFCVFDNLLLLRRMKRSEFSALTDGVKHDMLAMAAFISERNVETTGKPWVMVLLDDD